MTFGQLNLFRVVLTQINILIKSIKTQGSHSFPSLPPSVIYPAEGLDRSQSDRTGQWMNERKRGGTCFNKTISCSPGIRLISSNSNKKDETLFLFTCGESGQIANLQALAFTEQFLILSLQVNPSSPFPSRTFKHFSDSSIP